MSEQSLSNWVGQLGVAIFVYRGGVCVDVSPAAEGLTGYTRSELLPAGLLKVVDPSTFGAGGFDPRMFDPAGPISGAEVPYRTKRGDRRWALLGAAGLTDLERASATAGQPMTVMTMLDITLKKRAETLQDALYRISAAAHQAGSLETLYEAIHSIIGQLLPADNFFIALADPDDDLLRFVYFVDQNDPPPAPRRRGRTLTEYVLATGEPLIAPPPVLDELHRRGEVDLVGSPAEDWLGVPLKSLGRTIGVLVLQSYTKGVNFGEDDQEILEFVSTQIAMAIERKRAEKVLKETGERYWRLFERNLAGTFLAKRNGKILEINAAFSELFGYEKPSEILKLSLWDLLGDAARRELQRPRLGSQRSISLTADATGKDGRPLRLEIAAAQLPDGQPSGEELEGTVVRAG